MSKRDHEYLEYQEPEIDDYGMDSDEDIDLLDEIEDIEEQEEKNEKEEILDNTVEKTADVNVDLYVYLNEELEKPEYLRSTGFKFKYEDFTYNAVVMARSKNYPNRYVFKLLPDGDLKAFWIDEISLT